LEAFVRNATLKASIKSTTQDDTPLDASLMKTQKAETKPINVQRFAPSVPNVRWNDIGGLKEVKDKLKQATVWLYNHQETLQRLGIRAPRGVLLYGPPGTGKTLLAKAVATESSANFISVNIGEIVKAEVGESEKTIADIFRSARRCAPSIIFFDEFQALFGNRGTATHYEKSVRKSCTIFPAAAKLKKHMCSSLTAR
jgi:SpoVK/Ycf46/Vps4 family AAA+-type ATPase